MGQTIAADRQWRWRQHALLDIATSALIALQRVELTGDVQVRRLGALDAGAYPTPEFIVVQRALPKRR